MLTTNTKKLFFFIFIYAFFINYSPAISYIGPGMGGGLITALFGVVVAIIVLIFSIIYYPIKKLLLKKKKRKRKK